MRENEINEVRHDMNEAGVHIEILDDRSIIDNVYNTDKILIFNMNIFV